MKKFFVIVVILVGIVGFAFADTFNLGGFATGTWLDARYNAIWELTGNNIRLIDSNDSTNIYCDFGKYKMIDFKITPSTSGVTISFEMPQWSWKYELTKTLTDKNIEVKITDQDGVVHNFTITFTDFKVNL